MLPHWRDARDMLAMFRWFFGGKKPTFDHWTYWEKFDYWAEIFGTTVIGGTGVILWLAADAPQWLPDWLPGWAFNVATIIHGYEALLAVGFIFTIHFFNAHLRMEKFPVDDVMFTGSLPEEEFIHERGSEYQRARREGTLESLRVPAPPKWQRRFAVWTGILAMAVGFTIVALIVLAGLGAL
jgi:cytochrome b subunit of formate dehydrogenase